MKILINGIGGRMGAEVKKMILDGIGNLILAGGVDISSVDIPDVPVFTSWNDVNVEADCIVDFSHHSATPAMLSYAVEHNIPVVLATTGHDDSELALIKKASEKIALFHSANMSLGIALLCNLAKTAAKTFPDADIEIVETHHNRKLDAPSGTALMLAREIQKIREKAFFSFGRQGQSKRMKDEIGIHAVRRGNIVGIHEVIISTDTQTITLKHEAHSRALFAEGGLAAAAFLAGKPAGLYDMYSMIEN